MSTGVENTSSNDPTPRNVEPKNVGAASPAPPDASESKSGEDKVIDEPASKTASKPSSGEAGAEEGETGKENSDETAPEGGYPPQMHAGKVGYGPNYKQGGGIGDQITGAVEELKGKILHKPELVEHGKKVGTGELAREKKQQEQAEEDKKNDPFAAPDDKKKDDEPKGDASSKKEEIEKEAEKKKNE